MNPISEFLKVDGRAYRVAVLSIKRKAPILDKYAERTEDGALHRQPIGTYYNYDITFGWSLHCEEDYDDLWEALTAPVASHTIEVPYGRSGFKTFDAYISSVEDTVKRIDEGEGITYWQGLTAHFIAMKPART